MRALPDVLKATAFFVVSVFAVLVLLYGCGASSADMNAEAPSMDGDVPDGDYPNDDGGDYDSNPGVVDGDAEEYIPPEDEVRLMSRPVIGDRFVFVLNRLAETVVAIESSTLNIQTVTVGREPRFVTTLPNRDVALILNTGSDELAMLDMEQDRLLIWPLAERSFAGYNDIVVSPNGRFAILFFNHLRMEPGDDLGALQQVAILDLSQMANLSEDVSPFVVRSVGLNPVSVFYSTDNRRAFVTTDSGLTVIDLSTPDFTVIPNIPLEDQAGSSRDREVLITPDGLFALVRRFESQSISLVDLYEGNRHSIDLGATPTDMDLAPDGKHVYVVLRGDDPMLGIIPVPNGFADQEQIEWLPLDNGEGQIVLPTTGNTAVLFTNSVSSEQVTLLNLETRDMVVRYLSKGVEQVVISPLGDRALVMHTKSPGDPNQTTDIHERIDRSYGYSIVNLANEAVVLTLSDADQTEWVFTPEEEKLYLLVTNETTVKQVHIVNLSDPMGAQVSTINLGSVPRDIGVMAGVLRTYVSQEHTEGRITFLDWDDDDMITVTGFELNSEID